MKGMLVKDIMLLKEQKQFLLMVLAILALFCITGNDYSFTVAYGTMMCSMFTLNSFSYDEYENGMACLLTLPVSRRAYVAEKYVFGCLSTVLSCVLASLAAGISALLRTGGIDLAECLAFSALSGLIILLLLALTIPLQIKFGSEKRQLVLIVMMGGAFSILMLAKELLRELAVRLEDFSQSLNALGTGTLLAVLGVICLCLLGLSLRVSVGMMERKEY